MTPPVHVATADEVAPEEKADEAVVLEHEYDGIREYDNPLPGWWRAVFWGTIVFAAGYWIWFHATPWHSDPHGQYQQALAGYEENRSVRAAAEARNVSEESLREEAKNPETLAHGAAIFKNRCVSCHTEDGHGLIGPNLTDLYQKHGTTRMDIFNTISNGAPGTAMLAWGEQMPATDIAAAAAFVVTLRGKNIPGKAPEGQPVQLFEK
jgi:cytochrome c oxidase cbb3-type subunit III